MTCLEKDLKSGEIVEEDSNNFTNSSKFRLSLSREELSSLFGLRRDDIRFIGRTLM